MNLSDSTDYRRILIVKPSSLGDIIHALPALAALRRRFPHAYIGWLVKTQWAGLVERAEGLDAVYAVEPRWASWAAMIPRLRSARFDIVVDLQGLFRSGVMSWLSGCAVRVGFANGREGSPWFYTKKVEVPAAEMHAVDRYLLVTAALGAPSHDAPAFALRAWPGDREEAEAALRSRGVRRADRWLAFQVAARWPTKQYPPELFAAVADRLQSYGHGPIVFIGGPDDRTAVATVMGRMTTRAVDVSGLLPISLLPALLRTAAALVTNDSGPMHVAAAVGTPVVALFGPTSPARTGPYASRSRVLQANIPCSPCFSRSCRNANELECLRSISVESVVEAVREMIGTGTL